MSDTVLNLLLAVFLLAANAFFVAAEFALVKTRGFRIDALGRGGPLRRRADPAASCKNIEAYLACCQLGITMASLGLGWVGEPTVAALLEPVLDPLGMPERRSTSPPSWSASCVFSSLHIVVGEQVPKTLAIREPEPVSLWVAYPLHVIYPRLLSAQLAAQRRLALDPAAARRQGGLASGDPDRRRDRGAGRGLRRARQDGGEPGRVHPQPLPLRRARGRPTSWSTAPTCMPSTSPSRPRRSSTTSSRAPTPACRSGRRAGEHRRRRPRQGSAARRSRRPAAT